MDDGEIMRDGSLITPLIGPKITQEMRQAAEKAVMILLCEQLGPHYHWDWIVDGVIEALSQPEAAKPST